MSARQDMHPHSDQQQSQSRDRDARATTLLSLLHPSSSQQQQQPTLPNVPAPISGDIYSHSLYPPVSTSTSTTSDAGVPQERDTRASISVDALFRNIVGPSGSNSNNAAAPNQQQQQPQQQSDSSSDYDFVNHPSSTASAIQQPQSSQQQHPMDSPNASNVASISAERQNALLSLLGNVGSPSGSDSTSLEPSSSLSGHRPLPQISSTESQSRYLLDQILP